MYGTSILCEVFNLQPDAMDFTMSQGAVEGG